MTRRARFALRAAACLALAALAAPLVWHARPAALPKIPRIGYLSPTYKPSVPHFFTNAMKEIGYVEGKTVAIDYRFAEGHDALLPSIAKEMVAAGERVIVAQNPLGSVAARNATNRIPVVFVAVADPVGLGLVANLARPGGNVTGIMNMPNDLSLKRLELVKDALPGRARIAVVRRPASGIGFQHEPDLEAIAAALSLTLRFYDIAGPQAYESGFARIEADGMQAVLLMQDAVFFITRDTLIETAGRHHLPVIADSFEYAESGALLAYGIASYVSVYQRVADYVDRILKGANPATLPVQQPLQLDLAINLRAGKALGISVERGLLLRAKQVIE